MLAIVGSLILPWLIWQAMHDSAEPSRIRFLRIINRTKVRQFFLAGLRSRCSQFRLSGANFLYLVLSMDHMIFGFIFFRVASRDISSDDIGTLSIHAAATDLFI